LLVAEITAIVDRRDPTESSRRPGTLAENLSAATGLITVKASELVGQTSMRDHGFVVVYTGGASDEELAKAAVLSAAFARGRKSIPGVDQFAIHNGIASLVNKDELRESMKFYDFSALKHAATQGNAGSAELHDSLLPIALAVDACRAEAFGAEEADGFAPTGSYSIIANGPHCPSQIWHTDRNTKELATATPSSSGVAITFLDDNGGIDIFPRSAARFAEPPCTSPLQATLRGMLGAIRIQGVAGYTIFMSAYAVHRGIETLAGGEAPRLHCCFDNRALKPIKDEVYIVTDSVAALIGLALPSSVC